MIVTSWGYNIGTARTDRHVFDGGDYGACVRCGTERTRNGQDVGECPAGQSQREGERLEPQETEDYWPSEEAWDAFVEERF